MSDIIMLDTSIFGALNRANSGPIIAKDLLELTAAGETLMIGNSSYQEILNTPDDALRNTQLRQIQDFKVQIQPATTMGERVGAISEDYINATVDKTGTKFTPKSAGLEVKDLPVVSDVKVQAARMPNRRVKFFTVDRLVKNHVTISKAYKIEFSARARPLNNMGARVPYDPKALGIKPTAPPAVPAPVGNSGPTNAAAKAGEAKPTTTTPVRPGGSGTSVHTVPSQRFAAAKNAFKSGFAGAFSAANIASMIPDVILALADKAAVRDAMRNIQTKFLKEGFGRGVAAALMGLSQDDVDLDLKNLVTHGRVRGLGDAAGTLKLTYILQLAELSENYAVDIGYYWASIQTDAWRQKMIAEGWALLDKQNYNYPNEYERKQLRFINTLAYILRHKTDAIIGPAIKFN